MTSSTDTGNPYATPDARLADVDRVELGPNGKPKRHGFLALMLWLGVISYVLLVSATFMMRTMPGYSSYTMGLPGRLTAYIVIAALIGLTGNIALLLWKKWGWWVILANGLSGKVIIAMYVGTSSIPGQLGGLLRLGLLYWALQMGGTRKAWPYLD